MIEVVALSGCLLLLFALRSIYRVRNPHTISRDGYGHMMLIEDIRKSNHRYPEEPSLAATSGYYSYPFFCHWVLSFIPGRYIPHVDRYFSGLADVVLMIPLLLLYVTDSISFETAFFGLLLVTFTPELARPDLSHGKGLSGRKPGVILTTVSVFCFVVFLHTGSLAGVAIAAITASLVALTSKFGIQALVFIYVGFGILQSPVGFLIPPVGVLLAMVLSRGEYVHIFRNHISALAKYAREYDLYHPGSNIAGLQKLSLSAVTRALREKTVGKEELWVLRRVTLLRVLANNPYLLLLVAAPVVVGGARLTPVKVWILSGVGAFVLTSMPPLRFLGEPERYLEYTIIPAALYIGETYQYSDLYSLLYWAVIGGGAIVLLIYIAIYDRIISDSMSSRESFEEAVQFLSENVAEVDGPILVQPINDGRAFGIEAGHPVVDHFMNGLTTQDSVDEHAKLFQSRPYVTADVEWIRSQFDPSFVVFERERHPFTGLKPPADDPEFVNEQYEVYSASQFSADSGADE